jgi:hypothetical protein
MWNLCVWMNACTRTSSSSAKCEICLNECMPGPGGGVVGQHEDMPNTNLPAVLEPDFDLFGLNVCKDWTILNELLAAYGAWLGTLVVHMLQSLHLLICVSDIFPTHDERVHARVVMIFLLLHCLQNTSVAPLFSSACMSCVSVLPPALPIAVLDFWILERAKRRAEFDERGGELPQAATSLMLLFQPLFKIKLLFSVLEANRKAYCCKSRLGSESCKDELTAPSGDQSSYRTQANSHQSSAAVHGGKLRSRQKASTEQLQNRIIRGSLYRDWCSRNSRKLLRN